MGSMTIADVEPNRSLHATLEFKEPMQSLADDYMAHGNRLFAQGKYAQACAAWEGGRLFVEHMTATLFRMDCASLRAQRNNNAPEARRTFAAALVSQHAAAFEAQVRLWAPNVRACACRGDATTPAGIAVLF